MLIAERKGGMIGDDTVVMLDRARHEDARREVREAGARIRLISDGDVSAAILSPRPTQRAAARAAASVTRTSSSAMLRSGLVEELPSIGAAGYRVAAWVSDGD
jgi:hypothetical protein